MPTFPDMSGQTTSKPPSNLSSGKAGGVKLTSTKPVDCGPLVNKIVEGLRGDAFAIVLFESASADSAGAAEGEDIGARGHAYVSGHVRTNYFETTFDSELR